LIDFIRALSLSLFIFLFKDFIKLTNIEQLNFKKILLFRQSTILDNISYNATENLEFLLIMNNEYFICQMVRSIPLRKHQANQSTTTLKNQSSLIL